MLLMYLDKYIALSLGVSDQPLVYSYTHTVMAVMLHTGCWPHHWERFQVQCLARGHFDRKSWAQQWTIVTYLYEIIKMMMM